MNIRKLGVLLAPDSTNSWDHLKLEDDESIYTKRLKLNKRTSITPLSASINAMLANNIYNIVVVTNDPLVKAEADRLDETYRPSGQISITTKNYPEDKSPMLVGLSSSEINDEVYISEATCMIAPEIITRILDVPTHAVVCRLNDPEGALPVQVEVHANTNSVFTISKLSELSKADNMIMYGFAGLIKLVIDNEIYEAIRTNDFSNDSGITLLNKLYLISNRQPVPVFIHPIHGVYDVSSVLQYEVCKKALGIVDEVSEADDIITAMDIPEPDEDMSDVEIDPRCVGCNEDCENCAVYEELVNSDKE